MTTIPIKLNHDFYDILIDSNIRQDIQKTLQTLEYQKRNFVIITDRNIEKFYKDYLDEIFGITPRFVLEPGENSKSLNELERCYNFLIEKHIERNTVLFAIGGGVVGDIGGFIAATYMRGIEYYQVPTSLLAMVDSSVGGKTSINLKSGKNLIGAFYQPKGVLIGVDFLKTLSESEFASGMSEVIKYGLIADKELFEGLEKDSVFTKESVEIKPLIIKCCQIKVNVIDGDEKDLKGKRALLNLGHTFGHAIEQAAGYGNYLHGEAVSIGIVMAAQLSELLGYIPSSKVNRIKTVMLKYNLPIKLKNPIPIVKLNEAIHHDKKSVSGGLHFIVLRDIGNAEEIKKIDEKWLHFLWREIGAED